MRDNDQNISTTKATTDSDSEKRKREEETEIEDKTKDKRQKTQDNRKPYEGDLDEDEDEIEKGNEHIRRGRGSSILNLSIFKIHKRCIDCDGEYEAIYNEIGGLNCWV